MELPPGIAAGDRLIAIPGNTKYELCLTEDALERHRELANQVVRDAQAVLFYGYGFNDRHLETALRQRLKLGMPAIILAHSLTDNALKVARSFPTVWALSAGEDGKAKCWHSGFGEELGAPVWDLSVFLAAVMGV